MTSRNELYYQTLKTALVTTGYEFQETYNINTKVFPYIYLEIGDETFDYENYESARAFFKTGECEFNVYVGFQSQNDKNINANIRPEMFEKIDIFENKINSIQLPINDTYETTYKLNITEIRVNNNYKAYNEARVEFMISGIIKFTITYL